MTKTNKLMIALLLTPLFFAINLMADEGLEKGWEIIKKSIDIENNSFFPLKITYKKGTQEKTKYLPIDFGHGYHGPMISIKNPDKIKGNIKISIAMPYKFDKVQEWVQWIDQQSPIKIGETATKWKQKIVDSLPQKDAISGVLSYLYSFDTIIDPSKYEKNGAIVHFFWPLISAAFLKGPMTLAIEPNSTAERVWQALRLKTGKMIQFTQKSGLQTYDLLKSWISYDLPNLIRSKQITKDSTTQEIVDKLPAKIKKFEGWKDYKIIEEYEPKK